MKSGSTDKRSNGDGYAGADPAGESLDDFVGFARQHFATGFPNPARINCPSPEIYSDLISRQVLPDEELQLHLLSCSECFQLYEALLNKGRKSIPVSSSSWIPAIPGRRLVLNFSLAFLLICVISLVFYGIYRNRQQQIDSKTAGAPPLPQPTERNVNSEGSANVNSQLPVRSDSTPVQPVAQASPRTALIARHVVDLNFERQRISRSGRQREIPPVTVVAGVNRVSARLRAGSPKGEYALTLNDPFGKEVRPLVSSIYDGQVLRGEIDLSSVSPGHYLICITRATEVPDCLPVIVKK